jgi:hypothetical protein
MLCYLVENVIFYHTWPLCSIMSKHALELLLIKTKLVHKMLLYCVTRNKKYTLIGIIIVDQFKIFDAIFKSNDLFFKLTFVL